MNERPDIASPLSGEAAALSPLQRAFLAMEQAEARLATMQASAREPIAVIGLGCRAPGGANDAASFWRLLADRVDATGPVPSGRWDVEALYDPDPATPGRIATRNGAFLAQVDQFDPEFFGVAPREANSIDPQQRLLLEVSWEALENAGQAPDRLERTPTGVYFGVASGDYSLLQIKSGDAALLDAHFASGMAHSIASGRLSYLLGLQGPSLSIDTACSSSLVAVHLACQALRAGECRMALAGGVNLILSEDLYIALSHARMLAPDGRCKTFDAAADGFARGEGCGVVVLKRLSDTQTDGDRVLALIRGSAVNQDGPSSGLTAPNGPAQVAVIRDALARAGVAPRDVGYVEAHGTGTELGDPLEAQALGDVFAADREEGAPLLVGSVKTNIGHLEAAAGVVGLIKIVLSLQNRAIPAHLHFHRPSPHIPWSDLPLKVPVEQTPWPELSGRRIGGVSSFGFSGTNAHVVLEEAPPPPPRLARPAAPAIMTLSARTAAALAESARRHASALEGRSDADLADVCFSANAGRAQHAHRATIVAATMDELRARLAALAAGDEARGLRATCLARRDPPRIAFLFTGQGSQYAGMARGLYELAPAFKQALDACATILTPLLPRPLLDTMFSADGDALNDTANTQPALFALEYALAELLRSYGVAPVAVLGHSVGEYAAACVAGSLALEDGLRLVARRGALMQSLPRGGAMAAIHAPEADVVAALAPIADRVSIAAVNEPGQCVVSGAAADVSEIVARFAAQGARTQKLAVSHAFHSPLLDPILARFEREAATASFAPPRIRLISNLTGRAIDVDQLRRPDYWRRHAREAVRFADGVTALAAHGIDAFVEIGPHPTLLSFARASLGDAAPALIPTLRSGRRDCAELLDALSALYHEGARIDWRGGTGAERPRIVDLPSYPFERRRFWFAAGRAAARAPHGSDPSVHPLLGSKLRTATAETIFESRIGADMPAFVRQHRVLDRVVLPATAYLDALLSIGRRTLGSEEVAVADLAIGGAMALDDDGAARLVQTVVTRGVDGALSARICSASDSDEAIGFVEHASATLAPAGVDADGPSLADAQATCRDEIDVAGFYARFSALGLAFGRDFRSIRALSCGSREALATVEIDGELAREAERYFIHPVLLDGCLQALAAAFADEDGALRMPIGVGRYALHRRPGPRLFSHAKLLPGDGAIARADIRIYGMDGVLVAVLSDLQLKKVSTGDLRRAGDDATDAFLYESTWRDAPLGAEPAARIETAPSTLAARVSQALPSLKDAAGIAAYDAFLPAFDALCVAHIERAMRRLDFDPAPGEIFAEAALADSLGIDARHRRLFGRLLEMLSEASLLTRAGEQWRVMRAFASPDVDAVHADLARRAPAGAEAELELTHRVARELAEALRGERDPLDLLFPGGSLETAQRVYRDSPTAKLYNGMIAAAIGAAADAGRPLRILEIGAGTGGTTAHVAPRLPEGVEYVFTDVGPAFVAQARKRFGAYSFMSFETLDLEKDPRPQLADAPPFDIVIASNVIHATSDLARTLERVRGLLAPGGLLAMLEVTAPQYWFDLTVGLTPGWWAFEDRDLRPRYPTLSRESWLALLARCGFEEAAAAPLGEAAGALSLQSLFLARRSSPAGSYLLFADAGGAMAQLAAKLRVQGATCTLVTTMDGRSAADARIDPRQAAEIQRVVAAAAANGGFAGVVHGWSLDAPYGDSADLDAAYVQGVNSVLLLTQAILKLATTPRLWLVTRGAQAADGAERGLAPASAALWGFAQTVRREHPELACVAIDLDPDSGAGDATDLLAAEIAQSGAEPQVAFRRGARRVARLAHSRGTQAASRDKTPPSAWRLRPTTPGSMEAFTQEPMERRAPSGNEVEIAVEATGLNFKDTLNVLGLYPGDAGPLGSECAGRVARVGAGVAHVAVGDEVVAVAGGSFASHVVARGELTRKRPPGMSAEEGASLPIPCITAEFCLSHLARLRAGERVLIHAAAGGVGMAAVRLAQRASAEIFATAGSEWKRALLRDMGVEHTFDSRNTAFADDILARTNGRGVDVVLNSLAGDVLEASFRAIATGGRFIEIGKRGVKDASEVDALGRGLKYHLVDWGETVEQDPTLIGRIFSDIFTDIASGAIAPLPRHVFGIAKAGRAFRFMAAARHVGKVVVRHGAPAAPALRRNGTYLITGGMSGLGLLTARRLAEQGAGRLALIARRGPTPETEAALAAIRGLGATVVAEAVDVSDEAALGAFLRRLRRDGPPLRGVIHSAGALDDGALMLLDPSRMARTLAPKARGALLLDRLTRGDALDFFVGYSSVAAILGSPGQANHSAANAVLDLLAHERRERGLAGLSVNWGAWSVVGAAADRDMGERLAAQGLGLMSPTQGLAAFERALELGRAQVVALPIDWRTYAAAGGAISAYLGDVARQDSGPAATPRREAAAAREVSLQDELAAAPAPRRAAIVAGFVSAHVLRALGMDTSGAIDPQTPLGELGLDSLLSVELRNVLGVALKRPLPASLLFDYPTIEALTRFLLAEVLKFDEPRPQAAATPVAAGAGLIDSIDDLSDEEVERQLAARMKKA